MFFVNLFVFLYFNLSIISIMSSQLKYNNKTHSYSQPKSINYQMVKKYLHPKRILKNVENSGNAASEEIENGQFYYTIKLDFGNPLQFFEVLVDSSNEVTWVPSSLCKNCGEDLNSFIYPVVPKSNSNLKTPPSPIILNITQNLELENNGNRLKGEVLKSTATIHDSKYNLNITVNDMEILLVNEIDQNFTDFLPGKLGLTYKSRGNFDFLNLLKKQGLINRRLFAISEEGMYGKLSIGDLPSKIQNNRNLYSTCNVTENIKWFTKNERYLNGWVCELSHAFMGERTGLVKIRNDTKTSNFLEITGFAYFNTGSFIIGVPMQFFKLIVENYLEMNLGSICTLIEKEGEKYFTCPRDKVDFKDISPISFIIDGWAYEIPSAYLFVISDDIWSYEFLVRGIKTEENIWQFGQPFFRQYISVFDKDSKQVGFFGGEKLNFQQTFNLPSENGVINGEVVTIASGYGWFIILVIILIIAVAVFFFLKQQGYLDKYFGEDKLLTSQESDNNLKKTEEGDKPKLKKSKTKGGDGSPKSRRKDKDAPKVKDFANEKVKI